MKRTIICAVISATILGVITAGAEASMKAGLRKALPADKTTLNLASSALYFDKLATAIKTHENSTKHPYGIMLPHGRKATKCYALNLIRYRQNEWQREGSRGNFVAALADKWCPPKCDPQGNRNWKRNVPMLVKKGTK